MAAVLRTDHLVANISLTDAGWIFKTVCMIFTTDLHVTDSPARLTCSTRRAEKVKEKVNICSAKKKVTIFFCYVKVCKRILVLDMNTAH